MEQEKINKVKYLMQNYNIDRLLEDVLEYIPLEDRFQTLAKAKEKIDKYFLGYMTKSYID